MSTDRIRRIAPRRPLGLAVLLVSVACALRASTNLADLCTGTPVRQELTIVLDTVLPPATRTLNNLAGERFHMTLRLLPVVTPGDCGNSAGEAAYEADLPPEMKAGISDDASPTWLLVGTEVVVDFNPDVASRRLQIRLPLDPRPGQWTLSAPAGDVARGRVLRAGTRD